MNTSTQITWSKTMKAILATVIAASLAIGCGVIEEEQTTTETGGTTRTDGGTSPSSITPEFTEFLGDGEGRGVMLDSAGNIYLIGTTHFGLDGNFHTSETCVNLWSPDQDPPPCTEVFVMKFDNNHNKLWTTQFGARQGNSMVWGTSSMAIDSSGNIFVEGQTEGGINDQSHSGSTSNDGPDGLSVPGWDTFLVKLNSLGEIEWTIQKEPEFVGTSSIAADSQGSIYTRWNYENLDIPTLTKHQDNGTELWNTPMIPSEAIAVDSSDYLYAAGSDLGK